MSSRLPEARTESDPCGVSAIWTSYAGSHPRRQIPSNFVRKIYETWGPVEPTVKVTFTVNKENRMDNTQMSTETGEQRSATIMWTDPAVALSRRPGLSGR